MEGVDELIDGDMHDFSDEDVEDGRSMCDRSICGSSICDDPTDKNTKCHRTAASDQQDTMDEDDNLSVCDVATRPKKRRKERPHCATPVICAFLQKRRCVYSTKVLLSTRSQDARSLKLHNRSLLISIPVKRWRAAPFRPGPASPKSRNTSANT